MKITLKVLEGRKLVFTLKIVFLLIKKLENASETLVLRAKCEKIQNFPSFHMGVLRTFRKDA